MLLRFRRKKKRNSIRRKLFTNFEYSKLNFFFRKQPAVIRAPFLRRRFKKVKRSRRYGFKKFKRRLRRFKKYLTFLKYNHPRTNRMLRRRFKRFSKFYIYKRSNLFYSRFFSKFYFLLNSNITYRLHNSFFFQNLKKHSQSLIIINKEIPHLFNYFIQKRIWIIRSFKFKRLISFKERAKKAYTKAFYQSINIFKLKRSKLLRVRTRRRKIKKLKNIKQFKSRAQFHVSRISRLVKYGKPLSKRFAKAFRSRFSIRVMKTYNNFFIALQTNRGENVFSYSTGRVDLRRNRRLTKQALEIASRTFSSLIRKRRFNKLSLRIVGRLTYHSRVFIRNMRQFGIKLSSINFVLRRAHNGLRQRASRRV